MRKLNNNHQIPPSLLHYDEPSPIRNIPRKIGDQTIWPRYFYLLTTGFF